MTIFEAGRSTLSAWAVGLRCVVEVGEAGAGLLGEGLVPGGLGLCQGFEEEARGLLAAPRV